MKKFLLLNAYLVILFLFFLNIGCTTNGEAAEVTEPTFPAAVYDSESALQNIDSNLGSSQKSQGSMGAQASSLSQRGITVTGSGSVNVEPNLAILNIGVEVLAKTVNVARLSASDAMDSVTDTLKKEGVRDTD
ncbi:MAG: SIMPL domain-containing protein, partial [Chloroflexota bacterium]|nr:SIMPL domain-containing protein [Chloroflexota bacterium]